MGVGPERTHKTVVQIQKKRRLCVFFRDTVRQLLCPLVWQAGQRSGYYIRALGFLCFGIWTPLMCNRDVSPLQPIF